ncbi:acyl carrier protein [Ruminiclostridium papyrosolvens]|uniref:Carrier domain-containing protein n=1 Tax=Ruminiclostridium papyrosolvens C7 TaxID=1330534 RepID=U4QZN5_9FIRM|nr:phosphopantetheine-binding protein [Ruminiclostridium papyrosolvens]EPR10462.1 hypothetical protein L323_12480 [Ruminiclostridium papyrosolvens C7]
MTANEVKNRVMKILNERLELNITDDSKFDDFLANVGITSMTFIKLLVEIETEFGIEFETGYLDIKKFESIRTIISYIEELLNR